MDEEISDFTTLSTTSILPVDLNMELDIAFLAKVVEDNATPESFLEASRARNQAINSVFWNEEKGNGLITGSIMELLESHTWEAWNQNHNVYALNYAPLWIDLFNSETSLVEKVRQSLQSSGLVCAAGIATSTINSGEQRDFPDGLLRFGKIRITRSKINGTRHCSEMDQNQLCRVQGNLGDARKIRHREVWSFWRWW
ncbi:hypothetical protein Dsin_007946 [Dipteronia sinensis]|uniref:alpha,alpha-trehalase n=1 Tax=Dipteronia sinensis TaxID=43782 RepID=A0AAE0EHB9_9ROSI|nr:hypothetical protein Dsin_007946 [Dipteronia sinensis]